MTMLRKTSGEMDKPCRESYISQGMTCLRTNVEVLASCFEDFKKRISPVCRQEEKVLQEENAKGLRDNNVPLALAIEEINLSLCKLKEDMEELLNRVEL